MLGQIVLFTSDSNTSDTGVVTRVLGQSALIIASLTTQELIFREVSAVIITQQNYFDNSTSQKQLRQQL